MKYMLENIKQLYTSEYRNKLQVETIYQGEKIELDISTIGLDSKPDCQIGNFARNFYFRTPKGVNSEQYSSITSLKRGVARLLKGKGFEVTNFFYEEDYKKVII